MIKDKNLKMISLTAALIGIVAIYIISAVQPATAGIGEITEMDSGKIISVTAKVISYSQSDSNTFLKLEDRTGNITAVAFRTIDIKEGDNVTVTGQINVYKGELEIILNSIKVV